MSRLSQGIKEEGQKKRDGNHVGAGSVVRIDRELQIPFAMVILGISFPLGR